MNFIFKIILLFISLKTIIISKQKKIFLSQYFIVDEFTGNIDTRSINFINRSKLKSSLNLIRIDKLNFKTLLNVIKIPNCFCYTIIKNFVNNKFSKKRFFNLMKKLFIFLEIKKIIMIDDYREMLFFNNLSLNLNIKILIYMHGRLSKQSDILRKMKYSKYLVWSEYFEKQLLGNFANKKKIDVVGCPNLDLKNKKKILSNKIQIKNCLILDEDYLDFNSVKNIYRSIIKVKKIKYFLKKKKTREIPFDFLNFCKSHNIKVINDNLNFGDTLSKYKIDCVVASTSTGLLESLFYNVIPIKINSNSKFREREFSEFVKSKLVFSADSKNLHKLLNSKFDAKTLAVSKNKLWGNIPFKRKRVRNIINNFIES